MTEPRCDAGYEACDCVGYCKQQQADPCIGNDPACPCQDGDLCHYKDSPDGKTKAMPVKQQAEPCGEVIESGGTLIASSSKHGCKLLPVGTLIYAAPPADDEAVRLLRMAQTEGGMLSSAVIEAIDAYLAKYDKVTAV